MPENKPSAAKRQREQMTSLLRSVPAPEAPPAARPARERKPAAARQRKAEHAPAEQKPQAAYDKRIPFMTDAEQHRALATARLEDGIEATTRLRAMVKLWIENERFRKRVNNLAADERLRDRLAKGYRR
jgi:hypothetical protein